MPVPPISDDVALASREIVSEVKTKLDVLTAGESPQDKKIIGQTGKGKDVRPIPTPSERRRLEFESNLFWEVYFKKKDRKSGKGKENKKESAADSAKSFASEISDLAKGPVDKKTVVEEATIFWEVYYDVKKKLEPPKDVKGKTKITPAKKAVSTVKGIKEKVPKKKGWFASLIEMLEPFIAGALIAIAPLILKFAAIGTAIASAILFIKNLIPKIGEMDQAFEDLREGAKETDEAFEKLAKKYDERSGEAEEDPERKREATALKLEKQIDQIRQEGYKKGRDETMVGWGDAVGMYSEFVFKNMIPGFGKSLERIDKERSDEREEIIRKYKDEAEAKAKPLLDMLDKIGGRVQAGDKGYGVAMGDKATPKQIEEWEKAKAEKLEKSRAEFFKKMEIAFRLRGETVTPEQQQKVWESWQKNVEANRKKALAEAEKMITGLEAKAKEKAEKEAAKKKAAAHIPSGGMGYYGAAHGYMDFVSRPGLPAIPFSSQDDILGFKQGGPVSDLLSSVRQGTTVNNFIGGDSTIGKFQLSEIRVSNMHLETLVKLTKGILARSGGDGGAPQMVTPGPMQLPPDSGVQGDMNGPVMTASSADYYNSEYSMHTPPVLDSLPA